MANTYKDLANLKNILKFIIAIFVYTVYYF